MTLHWWMHWFWVTSLLLLGCSSRAYPQQEELQQHMTTGIEPQIQPPDIYRPTERRGKAMYPQGKAALSTTVRSLTESPSKLYLESLSDRKTIEKLALQPENKHLDVRVEHLNYSESLNNTTNNTASPSVYQSILSVSKDINNTSAVVPILFNSTTSETITEASVNSTSAVNETSAKPRDNLTRHELIADIPKSSVIPIELEEHGDSDSKITEKPLSLEAALLENSPPRDGISASRPRSLSRAEDLGHGAEDRGHGSGGMDTGAIAGISFAALVLAALGGTTAFVLYRRRYLNKPQTLNDKCSNPDSSGYLDDSTIRENSEEMYSLDNDSFLNSLEAMTIQNYWTDSVKHTKL